MNQSLLDKLYSPSFDLEEAQKTMHLAGHEIVRLEQRIMELNEYNRHLRNEIEKLSLDLGLKDRGYVRQ